MDQILYSYSRFKVASRSAGLGLSLLPMVFAATGSTTSIRGASEAPTGSPSRRSYPRRSDPCMPTCSRAHNARLRTRHRNVGSGV